jgi:hypothetical protein
MHNQIRGLMFLAARLDTVTDRLEKLDRGELVATRFEGLTLRGAVIRLAQQLERVLSPVPEVPQSNLQTN